MNTRLKMIAVLVTILIILLIAGSVAVFLLKYPMAPSAYEQSGSTRYYKLQGKVNNFLNLVSK